MYFLNTIFELVYIISLFCFFEKTKAVVLYTDRFGHLIINTEIFFRENKLKDAIYFRSNSIADTEELLKLYEEELNIKVFSSLSGKIIKKFKNILNIEFIDLAPKTEPNNLALFNNKLLNLGTHPDFFKSNKYVTLSIRNSLYHVRAQGVSIDQSDGFRNTSFPNLKKALDYLSEINIKVYLINKSFCKYEHHNLYDVSHLPIKDIFRIINGCYFHMGTSTGIDAYPLLYNKHVLQINSFFGCSLNSRYYLNSGIVLPMKIFDSAKSKYLSISDMIMLYREIELKTKSSKIYDPSVFNDKGYIYIQNSSEEINIAVIELINLIENPAVSTNLQEKFWKKYPEKWVNIGYKDVVFHEKSDPSNCFISENFLRNYL